MRCDKCGVSAAEYELRKGLCLSCCATELERALSAWNSTQAVADNLKAELERTQAQATALRSDAARVWASPETVRVLTAALETIALNSEVQVGVSIPVGRMAAMLLVCQDEAKRAFAHVREKGLK